MRVQPEGPQLISDLVRKTVGIDCSVLMGANIAEVSVSLTVLVSLAACLLGRYCI